MAAAKDGHTVGLGDLNDPEAATSRLLAGPGDQDVTLADKGDAVHLYNLMSAPARRVGLANNRWFLPEGERFARSYWGRGKPVDHIYASRGLLGDADLSAERWRLREVRSLVTGSRGEGVGDGAGARIGEVRPDHAPVYASFELQA